MECYWAQQHVSIDSEGIFRPCCAWRSTGIESGMLLMIIMHRFLFKSNKDLANNIWP